LRARYGKDVRIKRISPETGSLLKKLLSGSETAAGDGFGSGLSLIDPDRLLEAVERRALWSRFGL